MHTNEGLVYELNDDDDDDVDDDDDDDDDDDSAAILGYRTISTMTQTHYPEICANQFLPIS